jgi:hypothetical protein
MLTANVPVRNAGSEDETVNTIPVTTSLAVLTGL